ncbi:MAG: bacillithiol biosynthesis deacetylase BshB1, partial [Chlorobiota bacterium]
FGSQFFDPKNKEPETFISKQDFMEFIESRAKVYGFRIGKSYGEAFFTEEHIELDLVHRLKHH